MHAVQHAGGAVLGRGQEAAEDAAPASEAAEQAAGPVDVGAKEALRAVMGDAEASRALEEAGEEVSCSCAGSPQCGAGLA